MDYIIRKNPDEEFYKEITEAVKLNEGYCPCMVDKTNDTKCMCKDFRDKDYADYCHCGRYYKVPKLDIIALVGVISDDNDAFAFWENLLNKQNFIVLPVPFDMNNTAHITENYQTLCRAKIDKADAVFVLDDGDVWLKEMEEWAQSIGKKVLHRSDLNNES